MGVRRQARGQRRIEQILDAAGRVLAELGYGATTTNAIAAAAGISPGSLYQFFANKEAIAAALEARYAEAIRRAQAAAEAGAAGGTLEEAVGRLVDDVVAYGVATPGFRELFAERGLPDHLATSTRALHAAVVGRVRTIVDRHVAGRDAAERTRIASVAVALCRGLTPAILAAERRERAALADELKRALTAYLAAG